MKTIILLIIAGFAFAQSPTDVGPYTVGCRMRTLTKLSVTDSTERVMDTYIWYPADPVFPYYVPEVNADWNARPMGGDTARPVLIFSHGGCGHPLAAVYYTSFIASWGFIVIATMHPGSMYGDPDCLDSATLHDTWLNRPDDVEFSLRTLIALSRDSSSLFGVFDTTRMGMSGHSFGARTTYAMLNRTDYFLCGLAFSGNYIDRWGSHMNCMEDVRGVHQPIMIQNGTYDMGLTPINAAEIYDTLEPPKHWVEIHRVGHFQWGDTCTPERDPQCGADSLLSYAQAHYKILKYSVPFLMHYLMGDNRFDTYLVDTLDTFVTLTFDTTLLAVNDKHSQFPIELDVNPNPFNSSVNITVRGVGASCSQNSSLEQIATIKIYDINGHLVGDLFLPLVSQDGSTKGPTPLIWHPGKTIHSGVYFVLARFGSWSITKRIVYLK